MSAADYISIMDVKTAALIAHQFVIYGELENVEAFGNGHINDTFVSLWNQAGTLARYTHQRINHHVFTRPDNVMENINRVTNHIAQKLRDEGISGWNRRTLTVVPTKDGALWARDADGNWWRSYLFIENVHTREICASPDEARVLGASAGRFQKQLADLPAPRLHDTIPAFHNMEKRYARFHEALAKDAFNRAQTAAAEIAFMQENENRGGMLIRALNEGRIPERIAHNDTKMNNILLDDVTGDALCVIDLDTVMPGTCLFDAGDLIRTVATKAAEDERDLNKVSFALEYFEALIEGYLSEASFFLTEEEKALITESGRNITHIMALRFLTDYLEGDHYYHISRDGHNLDRCRNQIALVRSIDAFWDEAQSIVDFIWTTASH
jgi:Ser/Thr protein kinase RdoA (MazF antagonist)